jgi:CRP/FNR family transcriptional regulator
MRTARKADHPMALAQRASKVVAPLREARVVRINTKCSLCSVRGICPPCGLDARSGSFDQMGYARVRVLRGTAVFRTDDAFVSLYAIRAGSFKTRVVLEDGRDQVTGFQMSGDVLGMDAISGDRHVADMIALEDSEVCVIPYAAVQQPALQRQLQKAMSRELVREQGVMMLLGRMRAEERLAIFLLNLSLRFAERGFSAREFHLRMTREEIGSFLGLSLETVSRCSPCSSARN